MSIPPPSPDRLLRFSADVEALAGRVGRFGVAVSGGPDSLALLLLAAAAFPGSVEAVTVDHGLRPESGAEAQFVAGLCADLGIPHAVLRPAEPITGSLQAAARRARYRMLEAWRRARSLDWLMTAHHADDQAETLLMRMNRGSGVGGLGGVRAVNGRVIRPLLGWRHGELAALVADAGIEAVDDPSNADLRFDRTRIRRHLAEAPWLDQAAIARSAEALAEADEALEWAAATLAGQRLVDGDGGVELDARDLPAELRRRLVLRAIRRVAAGAEPRGDEVSRLITTLENGGIATLAGVKATGGHLWRFEPAPPRRPQPGAS